MAFNCEHYGYRSNEVKPGGGPIPKYGIRIQLTVQDKVDLTRDIIKSGCAGIEIPELELELSEGSLGGFYTTVEGLLEKFTINSRKLTHLERVMELQKITYVSHF
jgi:zinc finger protein